jgi:hypothetical protein
MLIRTQREFSSVFGDFGCVPEDAQEQPSVFGSPNHLAALGWATLID